MQAAVDTRHIEHTTLTSNGIWQSTESKGEIQQTLHMPQIHGTIPQGMSAYQGAGGVSIQLPKGSDLRQAIEAASQQPGGEYIAGLAQRSDIDWSQVEAINKTWDYKQEGLTPEAALIVSVIVTIATSGTVQTWAGALPGGAAAAGSTGLSALGASYAAGMSAIASTATVSLINNKGDIGAVLSELTSPANLQNLAVTMLTAGATQGLLGGLEIGGKPFGSINAASPFIDQLGKNILQGITNATVISAVTGQSYSDALAASLTSAFINTVGAQGANLIGDNGASLGPLGKDIAHALLGCAIGSASAGNSSGCAPGATGAVVGEMVASWYADETGYDVLRLQANGPQGTAAQQVQVAQIQDQMNNLARLVGAGSALLVGGDVASMNIAMGTASNAAMNNRQLHTNERELAKILAASSGGLYTVEQIEEQMRLMGNLVYGAKPNTIEVLTTTESIANNVNRDPGMVEVTDGKAVVEIPGQANMGIQQYIISNTAQGASYIPGVSPYIMSNPALNKPVTSTGPVSNTATTARCANGDLACISGVGAQQSSVRGLTQAALDAIADAAGTTGRQAGVVAAAATAVASAGSPQVKPIAGAVAAGATAIGVGAGAIEQLVRPDTGKVVIDSGMLILQTATEQIPAGRILTPITNELFEAWKSSGSSMSLQDWINSRLQGAKP